MFSIADGLNGFSVVMGACLQSSLSGQDWGVVENMFVSRPIEVKLIPAQGYVCLLEGIVYQTWRR